MVPAFPLWPHSRTALAWFDAIIELRKDDDPMHLSSSPRWKIFRPATVLGALAAVAGAGIALLAGLSPARAANLVRQPDMQVAVFIVPLALLIAVLLFEVARFVWRGKLPAETPLRSRRRTPLTSQSHLR